MARYIFVKTIVQSGLSQLRSQLLLWWAVLRSPLTVVMEGDPASGEEVRRAYGFFLFIFAVVFLLRVPLFHIFLGVDMRAPLNFVALFVLNAVSIAVFVLVFLVSAKMLFGKGSLRSSAVTGVYLTAFWPFLILASYLSGISRQIRTPAASRVSEWWFVEPMAGLAAIALLLFLFFYLIVKSVPAIKYVHRLGNIRAIIICGFGYVFAFEVQNWLVLKLLSEFIRLTG